MSAALGANVGLAGVHGVLHRIIEHVSPVLNFLLLLLQVAIASGTAWFLYQKIKEMNKKCGCKKKKKKPVKKPRKRLPTKAMLWGMVITVVFLAGCMTPHSKPGTVTTPMATQTQPFNPKDKTELVTTSDRTFEYVLPAGSTIAKIDRSGRTNAVSTVASDTPIREHVIETVDSSLGAADMSIGKMIAKLQSVKWIQGVGIVIFLFGIASFAWPPLRMVIGSVTTSAIIAAAGLGLIVLPTILIGNELLILLGCGGAALAYFFIHRYGLKSGQVSVLKKWVDRNGNGVVDPGEMEKSK